MPFLLGALILGYMSEFYQEVFLNCPENFVPSKSCCDSYRTALLVLAFLATQLVVTNLTKQRQSY